MTLRELIALTGRDRRTLARMLGYASKNSLTQAEDGKQAMPADKLAWLEAYVKERLFLESHEARWLKKNPPPNGKVVDL